LGAWVVRRFEGSYSRRSWSHPCVLRPYSTASLTCRVCGSLGWIWAGSTARARWLLRWRCGPGCWPARRVRLPRRSATTAVMWIRPGARFTADFEDLVVWLVTRSDKTTVAAFARVAWRTVGAMCERVAADVIDPHRLEGLVDIGVDEISWRKHHFSGDPKLSLVVSLGGDERGSCRSFCIACATWLPVRHTNLADPGEDATSRAQRDARVLDRR
jgi:hypothetical protein